MTPQEQIQQIHADWNEFKATLTRATAEQETFGATLGDTKAKLDEINARIDSVEVKLKAPGFGEPSREAKSSEPSPYRKSFVKMLRKGIQLLQPEELKVLTVSDDTGGGYLSEPEYVQEIIKDIVEWSPVRSVARIRTTSRPSVKIRKRTQTASAVFIGSERHTKTETQNPKYGLEEIAAHEMYAMADISQQDLEDSSFDLESELRMEFGEQFGVAESEAFINGEGNGEPEGLLKAGSGISEINTGHATELTYAGVNTLVHALKTGFARNARLVFNRTTLGKLRTMVDLNGDPLWVPLAADAPSTICGLPYAEFPDMPDVAAGAVPILVGDFRRGYIIVDRIQMAVLRDELTQATKGIVRFIARKRVGGQIVLPSAFKKLKVAA